MPRRAFSLAIVLLMVFSALVVLASSGWTPQGNSESQPEVKAHILDVGDAHTWTPTSGNLASTAANWNPASAPTAGDNIVFNSGSTACTWDIVATFGNFYMNATYTGTVTQTASFSVTSYSQASGTLTGLASYTLTDSGDFTKTGGTITTNVLTLSMTGTSKTFSMDATVTFSSLITSGSTTIASNVNAYYLTNSGTVSINTGKLLQGLIYFGAFSNTGTFNGLGTLALLIRANTNLAPGVINCPFELRLSSGAGASATYTLTTGMTLGASLNIYSDHATYTATVDLSASNYILSCTDLTIGTRSILNGRGSVITCSGNFDSSAETFTPGTLSVRLTGATKTLKTTGTSTFNKLFLDVGSSYTLSSNVITQQYWKNGTLTLGGYTLYVDADAAPSITSTPTGTTFACNLQFTYTYAGSDREGETLTYALTTNLSGLTRTTGNSTIWRHGANHARGTFTMHLSLTDGNHTVWQNSTLTVTNDAPLFTSEPVLQGLYSQNYTYYAIATDARGTVTYSLTSNLYGLAIDSTTGKVTKVAPVQNGTWTVSISATDGNYTTWQNYSLVIDPMSPGTQSLITLLLGLIFAFAFLFLGMKNPVFLMLAGIVWILASLTIFITYGSLFLLVGLGVGFIGMIEGGLRYGS